MAPSPEQKLIDEQRELIKIQQQLVQKQRSQIIDLKEMINELRGLNNQQLELSENQDKKIDEQKDLMGKLQSLNDKQQELCNQLCERIQQQAAVIEDIGIQCKELIARVASWEMYAEAKGVEIGEFFSHPIFLFLSFHPSQPHVPIVTSAAR